MTHDDQPVVPRLLLGKLNIGPFNAYLDHHVAGLRHPLFAAHLGDALRDIPYAIGTPGAEAIDGMVEIVSNRIWKSPRSEHIMISRVSLPDGGQS